MVSQTVTHMDNHWSLHMLLLITVPVTTGYFTCYYPLLLLLPSFGFITTCYYLVMDPVLPYYYV